MSGRVDHQREILHEAFTAGWQAALAVTITSPRVLAVVESCFELWLEEAVDETDVLGLVFRGRDDLPVPTWRVLSPFRVRVPEQRSGDGDSSFRTARATPAEKPAVRPPDGVTTPAAEHDVDRLVHESSDRG